MPGALSHTRRGLSVAALTVLLCASFIALAAAGDSGKPAALATARPEAAKKEPPRKTGAAALLAGFDPLKHREQDGRFVADLPSGATADLSLEPGLQRHIEAVFNEYDVPYGAFVALDPKTGRVLAYVSHSSANPEAGDLVRDPTPPAASVFKVVTGAALLDVGVTPAERVCYGGGMSGLSERDLADDKARDRSCASLAEAMGGSINTVFAKLADRKLDGARIARYAQAFGFGHALPFDAPLRSSPYEVPEERLERARTAAGFWHMHMSPLHGALIAATVANGGAMPRASMIDRVRDAQGKPLHTHTPATFRSVVGRSTASALASMMALTVSEGTAHSAFFDPKGRPYLPGISVAGKTGSLSSERPYRHYSWWVGFAPERAPEIALAALVVNTPKWRIKSSFVAREALRHYLVERPLARAKSEQVAAATPAQ
jgi:cell division protein FtsI/penicillin-binding protein 2